jgi:hypothetical protein
MLVRNERLGRGHGATRLARRLYSQAFGLHIKAKDDPEAVALGLYAIAYFFALAERI